MICRALTTLEDEISQLDEALAKFETYSYEHLAPAVPRQPIEGEVTRGEIDEVVAITDDMSLSYFLEGIPPNLLRMAAVLIRQRNRLLTILQSQAQGLRGSD